MLTVCQISRHILEGVYWRTFSKGKTVSASKYNEDFFSLPPPLFFNTSWRATLLDAFVSKRSCLCPVILINLTHHKKTSLVLLTWEVFRTTSDVDLVLFVCDYLLNIHKMSSNSIISWAFQLNKCELKPNAFSRKKKLFLDFCFFIFSVSGMHCFLDCL